MTLLSSSNSWNAQTPAANKEAENVLRTSFRKLLPCISFFLMTVGSADHLYLVENTLGCTFSRVQGCSSCSDDGPIFPELGMPLRAFQVSIPF
jgi:hypothetical protein